MVLLVDPDAVGDALAALSATGVDGLVVGRVEEGERGVEFAGPPLWDGPAASSRQWAG
jgi:hypothetical protein